MISLCSGVFILPFFLFSATAGQLADRYEKPRIVRCDQAGRDRDHGARRARLLARRAAHACWPRIFLLGVHSAFLGPIKYSILPQLVAADELVAGNALVEMGTFLAILAGTIGGGLLVLASAGPALVAGCGMLWAALGYLASLRIPRLPAVAPELRVSFNPFAPTLEILRITKKTRAVFLSVLGISWFWFFGAVFLTVLPTYARGTLRRPRARGDAVPRVFCVGIALGSLLCEKISGKNLELGLVPFGSIGMTLFTLDLFFVGTPEPRPPRRRSTSRRSSARRTRCASCATCSASRCSAASTPCRSTR